MTPIISPWIFYIIDVLGDLEFTLALIVVILIVVMGAYSFFNGKWLVEDYIKGDEDDDKRKIMIFKIFKRFVAGLFVCILFLVSIPSESTMYKMLVAQNVTSDNLNAATDIIKNGVDYIFDKLDGDTTTK